MPRSPSRRSKWVPGRMEEWDEGDKGDEVDEGMAPILHRPFGKGEAGLQPNL